MISLDETKRYTVPGLIYRGLQAQLPDGVNLGAEDTETGQTDTYVITGFWAKRLKSNGFDMDSICTAVFGTNLLAQATDIAGFEPKIMDIAGQCPEMAEAVDFRTINYRTGLTDSLYPKRTMEHGEIVRVEWFRDIELTDKVIDVNMNYVRDGYGFALERQTTREWIMKNGEPHANKKITKKRYDINFNDQIKEGKRRRENIVNDVQKPALMAMAEVLMPLGYAEIQILGLGRGIMEALQDEFKNFIENSSTDMDPSSPTFGQKKVVLAVQSMADVQYPWMHTKALSLGNMSLNEYLAFQFGI